MWKTDIFKWYSFFFSYIILFSNLYSYIYNRATIILLEMLMIPCQTCSYSSHYHCIIGYPQMFTTSKPNDSIPIHNFSDCILIPKLQTFKSTISYSQLKQYEEVYDSIIGIKKDSTSTEESTLTTPTGKQLMYTPIVWQCPICKTEQCSI